MARSRFRKRKVRAEPFRMRKLRALRRPLRRGFQRRVGFFGRFAGAGGELKFVDTVLLNQVPTTAGLVIPSLNVVPQGNGESERIGRKVTIKSISIRARFNIEGADSAVDGTRTLRFILYQDTQTNGAAATVGAILQTPNYLSFRQLDNTGRFRLLEDKYHTLRITASESLLLSFNTSKVFGVFKKMNTPIEYDNSATDGSIATQRSNNFGIILLGDIGGHATVDLTIRIRYSDN